MRLLAPVGPHSRHAGPRGVPSAVPALLLLLPALVLGVVAVGRQTPARAATTTAMGSAEAAHRTDAYPTARPFDERPLAVLPMQHRPHPQRASRSDARTPHRWVRPNLGPLTSPFGWRWGRLHAGIDLGGPYGSPILAATDGEIVYAGPEAGYGELIVIQDWDGTQTAYGHMSAFIRTSGYVRAGDLIALVGAAGDATGPHLHFEVRVNGKPINPIPFLAARGVTI